jgi:excinuclease ABC subunit A
MSKRSAGQFISLKGVRHNNLKNFDLDLPAGRLIVVTGLSGSGKSSLAFDTLYAEGQRRYIETFSPYARQFFDRMDKPQVDSIEGIPPAIAIEQRNSVKSTRSTIGTMTEICDYMKVVWSHIAQLYCRRCAERVQKDSPKSVWQELQRASPVSASESEILVVFELPLSDKLSIAESLALVAKQGYQRLLLEHQPANGQHATELLRLEEAADRLKAAPLGSLTIVQDRLRLGKASRARLIEACEQAYHFGKGKLTVHFLDGRPPRRFSKHFHCAECDLDYREGSPALFTFNHPLGACPECRGFGRTITIDYDLAIPDHRLTLAGGAVKPWQSGQSAECQQDLMKFCRKRGVPADVSFADLKSEWQQWVVDGDPGYGQDSQHQWPQAWYGVKGYFRWLESRAYKMHVRVLLSRYRAYRTCVACGGRRFQPEALLFKARAEDGQLITLSDFYGFTIERAWRFVQGQSEAPERAAPSDALRLVLGEVRSRLAYLSDVGLGYLTLDRPTRSLSGGETERVNLTTCLGARLVNTLFVLDEPSVGLHARDTQRLVRIIEQLRDAGNTVVVVEHEPGVMRAADQLVDLGPGHGESGGSLVFQGTFGQILKAPQSLTGQYLSGRRSVATRPRRPVRQQSGAYLCPVLRVEHAFRHNLKGLTAEFPLGRLVCVTGVSGSGKTTLVREILLPAVAAVLDRDDHPEDGGQEVPGSDLETDLLRQSPGSARLTGAEHIGRVVLVDQAALGKTPRSNPAVYIGAFEPIRELFAQSEAAHLRGLNASAFSFNSAQGQCELCRGAGFEKIEMQFLSDVFIRCPSCDGRRYRQHILDVTIEPPAVAPEAGRSNTAPSPSATRSTGWSIADLLDATVDESITFLTAFSDSRPAARALERLRLLQEVGLGYLRLGQPINTLSGGESQRLKLVSHLAEFTAAETRVQRPTLFLFDEPTTGLHFADVEMLVQVFQRLVDRGHSVIVVEHNLDLIKCADWVIDLGPEAGEGGGLVVAVGTPEELAACAASYTGQSLREVLGASGHTRAGKGRH